MTTVALIIAWVLLFAFRVALEWLAAQYEFFEQWLVITMIALIAVSVFLAIDLVIHLMKRYAEMRNMFPKSESQPMQAQSPQRKNDKEHGEGRSERREQRAARRAWRRAQRDKARRVESFEKLFQHKRGGK